jgi:hypothetical protein
MPVNTPPPKSKSTIARNANPETGRFQNAIDNAPFAGQLLAQVRHPVHSGEWTRVLC